MIVEFVTSDLLEAFKAIRNIFAKGPTSEGGNNEDCLVASKENGTVVLESANQGLYAKVTVKANVEEAGRVMIKRDLIAGLKLKGESTKFSFKEGTNEMKFQSGGLRGKINVSQNFDSIETQRPINVPDADIEVPWDAIKVGLKRVMFNPTTDEENPYLRIQLAFDERLMLVTAKDAYRGAIFRTKLEEEVEGGPVIVPAAFFASVIAAIQDGGDVHLGMDDRAVRIRGGSVDVCHPLLQSPEGDTVEAVDMDGYIAEVEEDTPHVEFEVDVKAMKDAVSGAASIVPTSAGSESGIDLTVKENGRGSVNAHSLVGNAEAKFTATTVTISGGSDSVGVSVDSKYLIECLALIGDGSATIRIWDAPIFIKSEKYGTILAMPQLNPEDEDEEYEH